MTEKIISKGFYTHPVTPNFVAPKQFMVLKKGKGSQLFIRFENPRNEILTAISFSVDCYDAEGRVVKTAKIEQHNLKVAAHSGFIANRPVSYDAGYADFKVTVNSAAYGDYLYVAHGDEVEVVYEKQDNAHEIDRTPFLQKLGGHTHRSFFRSLHTPKFFAVLLSLLVVSLFAVLGVKIYNFTRTEELFTLDMIEYTFASENRDGPIIILGTNSTAANIIVPDKIEGHDIVEVASGAFSKSKVRTIEFKGTINVAANAFSGSQKLQSVSFEAVETIGKNAFSNCKKLTEVVIGDGLATIGENAFDNCGALTTITLPDTVQSIGRSAFASCRSLTSLVIPDSTTYIGENILANCYAVSSLQTPFIGQSAKVNKTLKYFYGTATPSALKNLTVTKTNVIDTNLFNSEIHLETIAFTSSVTQIGDYAFYNCSALTTFNVPVTVESIGRNAFANCASLTSIAIPEKVTSISDNLFANCYALKTVTLPTTLTYVGDSAFQDCRKLTSLNIPASVTRIGSNALRNCVALTDLTLPFLGTSSDSILTLADLIASGGSCNLTNLTLLSGTVIPEYAFSGFKNLAAVSLPTGITTIGANAFYGCNALKEVAIPATVSTVSDYAFSGCTSLKKMQIPSTVTSVGNYAFSGCTSLSEVTFSGDATEIGEGAFYYCSSLSYVNLPNNLTTLAMRTFERCTSLESVVLPAGIATIPDYTFYTCTALKSVSLPAALTTIGSYAFAYCQSLPLFEFPSTVQTINSAAFEGCTSLTSITIPDTIVNIGASVFSGCSSVASITAPYPTEYSEGAYFNYYFSYPLPSSLKRITVSRLNSQYLPSNAFYGCSYLEEINLPVGVTEIGSRAFGSCSSLKTLTLSSSLSRIESHAFEYCQSLDSFEIASSVQYIGEGAFSGCSSLVSITIPDTVMSVGTSVFAGCSALVSMTAPYPSAYSTNAAFDYYFTDDAVPASLKNVTLTRVENNILPSYAFNNCYYIEEIRLPSTLTTIDQGAFSYCSSLKSITLPDNLSSVGSYAFSNCSSLTSLVIPDNVSSIGSGALAETTALTSITLPFAGPSQDSLDYGFSYLYGYYSISPALETVTLTKARYIPHNCFENMSGLRRVELPETLEAIYYYAFHNCASLNEIVLPSYLRYMDYSAFEGCTRLYEVTNFSLIENVEPYFPYAKRIFTADNQKLVDRIQVDGYTFVCDTNGVWYLTDYDHAIENHVLPSDVYRDSEVVSYYLPERIFQGNSNIKSISIPDNVIGIKANAFNSCSNLTAVTFGDNSQLAEIQEYAFSNAGIQSITLPASLSTLGEFAFQYCYNLGSVAFSDGCLIESIPRYSFYECTSLSTVSFGNNSQLAEIQEYAFYDAGIQTITFPNTLTSIGNRSFSKSNLVSITLPSSLTSMSEYAFAYCYYLQSVSFDRDATLGAISNGAFYSSTVISATVPASVTSIGEYAFGDCNSLESLSIGENSRLEEIGYCAFQNTGLINLMLPASLKTIGNSAFNNCSALQNLTFEANSQLEAIGGCAFQNTGLINLALPASLKTIGYSAFCNCSNLQTLTFEEGSQLSAIGEQAFYYSGLQSVALPALLETIGYHAFSYSDALSEVTFAADSMLSRISEYAFYNTAIQSIDLPEALTYIGYSAFANCGSLTSVTLRSSSIYIEHNSFYENSALQEVYNLAGLDIVPGSTNYGYVATNAIIVHTSENAESLHNVEVNGLSFKKSDNNWFLMGLASDNNPTELVLEGFTYNDTEVDSFIVYKRAFEGNTTLTSLTIGAAVSAIMPYAFSCCSYITSLTFDDDCVLTEIPAAAFEQCYNIRTVLLPDSVETIGERAFANCTHITAVLIPEHVSSIGNHAFIDCYNLYDVMDLSSLGIEKGSPDNGYVGCYALAVRDSSTPLAVTTITSDTCTAKFVKYSNAWYLIGLEDNSTDGLVVLPELTVDDTTYNYRIFACSMRDIAYMLSILIEDNIAAIDNTALGYLANYRIYFDGTASEWNKLNKDGIISNVYFYADCIHEDGYWNYDENGAIVATPVEFEVTEFVEPTCKDTGSRTLTCPLCEESVTEELAITDEHDIVDNQCTVCGKVLPAPVSVTSANFSSLSCISNNSSYPFAIDGNGVITSQNRNHSSSSRLTITASTEMTVSFEYSVSSEGGWDHFRAYHNGTQIFDVSGSTSYQSYSLTLAAGDTLEFGYSKDGSVSSGSDCGLIRNLVLAELQLVEP